MSLFCKKYKNSVVNKAFKNFAAYRLEGGRVVVFNTLFVILFMYWNYIGFFPLRKGNIVKNKMIFRVLQID